MLGADLGPPATRLLLQRDPQQAGGTGHHLRPVLAPPAGDAAAGGCDAAVVATLWHHHEEGGPAAGGELPGTTAASAAASAGPAVAMAKTTATAGQLHLRGDAPLRLGLHGLLQSRAVQQLTRQVCPVRVLPGWLFSHTGFESFSVFPVPHIATFDEVSC